MKLKYVPSILILFFSNTFAQWIQTTGPEPGFITSIAKNGSTLFVGTAGAGIHKSDDNGLTWTRITSGSVYQVTEVISVNGNTILATNTAGLQRSTDNGETWAQATGLPFYGVRTILNTGTCVLAGTSGDGVYRSADDGLTWTKSGTGITASFPQISSLLKFGSKIYAAEYNSMFLSDDDGLTWTADNTGIPVFNISNNFTTKGSKYFLYGNNSMNVSNDNGTTWSPVGTGLPAGTAYFLTTHNNNLFIAMDALYKSTDDGAAWSPVNTGLPANSIQRLYSDGTTLYAGTIGKGIIKSTDDGETWEDINSGIINSRIAAFAVKDEYLFAASQGSINKFFRTSDYGDTWEPVDSGLPIDKQVTSAAIKDNYIFAAAGTIYSSTNNGTSWESSGSGIPADNNTLSVYADGDNIFAGGKMVYKSSDNGLTWNTSNTGMPNFATVYEFARSGNNILAVTGYGIYLSNDGGNSWLVSNNGIASYYGTKGIIVHGGEVFIGNELFPDVYKSTDNGANWTKASNVPGQAVTSFASNGTTLFSGVINNGVYSSSNSGTSWTNIRTGLPQPGIVYYKLAIKDNYIFCGTDVAGVWRRPLSEITSVDLTNNSIPEEYSLSQNYPNPFNPTTNFEFGIANSGLVTVKIYDILGNEIAVLVNEEKEPGLYNVTFNASDLSSGVYMYKLTANNYSAVKKLVLLK